MSKTKIAGYLLVAVAVLTVAADALNGGDFNFSGHVDALVTALNGAGLVFLRDALGKIQADK